METVQVDKQNVAYTYNGILVRLKKEEHSDTSTTWKNLEDIMLSEITSRKRQILYNSTHM